MAAGKRLHIQELVEFAKGKNGKLLSEQYTSIHKKYKWQCSKGHVFEAKFANIKHHQSWCEKCGRLSSSKKRKLTVYKLKKSIKSRGFSLVSSEYKNNSSKIIVKCPLGHEIETTFNRIQKGDRCYRCNFSNENIAREIFRFYTGENFFRIRPNWLSYGNKRLELDGYSEKLKLAFEYQGLQHYSKIAFFHSKDEKAFEFQLEKDAFKKTRCKEVGVRLFVIGPFKRGNIFNDANRCIKELLVNNNVIRENTICIKEQETYKNIKKHNVNDLKKLAQEKEGEYLLDYVLPANEKGLWRCKNNHVFQTRIAHAKRGTWCQKCHFIKISKKREI